MEPEQELPFVAPQESPAVLEPQPMGPQPGVKTPSVLEVKRVELLSDVFSPAKSIAVNRADVQNLLRKAGDRFEINPKLAMAVVNTESDFNPRAVSSDGHASKGLFQLLDSTGRGLLARGNNPDRPYDPFNPEMNVELGTSYLRYLHDIFSKPTKLPNDHSTQPAADNASLEKLAVAAFNAGEGRVASAQTRAEKAGKDPAQYEQVEPYLPASTREYVNRVVGRKDLF
jgi:soluble lytic murein transglycosylase-like protein